MIEVKNLDVAYGKVQVVWDVSFEVNEGEIIALVGANASGKSTILKTIAGINRSMNGSILFCGKRIENLSPHRIAEAGISMIPEGRRLFSDMTVLDNLQLGAYRRKLWRDRKETLEEMYEIFPILKERKNQLAKTFSGGEQQMVAIARGLMSRPRLCLFDEPCFGLSPAYVQDVFKVIQGLRSRGTTVLIVEQNVNQTLSVDDRAYVLENGRIVLKGSGNVLLQNEHVQEAYLGCGKPEDTLLVNERSFYE